MIKSQRIGTSTQDHQMTSAASTKTTQRLQRPQPLQTLPLLPLPLTPSAPSTPLAPSAPDVTIVYIAPPRHNSDDYSAIDEPPIPTHAISAARPANPSESPRQQREVDKPDRRRVVVIRTHATAGLRPPRVTRARLPYNSLTPRRNALPTASVTPLQAPAATRELPPGPPRRATIPTLQPGFRTR